jgi:hypothetical protein
MPNTLVEEELAEYVMLSKFMVSAEVTLKSLLPLSTAIATTGVQKISSKKKAI